MTIMLLVGAVVFVWILLIIYATGGFDNFNGNDEDDETSLDDELEDDNHYE